MQNRDQVDEDAFQCKYCTDLCYWSMIKCSVHTCSLNTSSQERIGSEEKQARKSGRKYLSKQEKRALALEEAQESE